MRCRSASFSCLFFAIPFALVDCKAAAQISSNVDNVATSIHGTALPSPKAIVVEPITAVSAGLSMAGSLKNLIGNNSDWPELKGLREQIGALKAQIEYIKAVNDKIELLLPQINSIMDDLGTDAEEHFRLKDIFENQARLNVDSHKLYDTWLTIIENRRASGQATKRYRDDILPSIRDTTRQLMEEGYGYSAYNSVGLGMLMEFWLSREVGDQRSLRRNGANAYLAYFDRALSPQIDGTPGKLLANAEARRNRLKSILDAADIRIGSDGWEVAAEDRIDVTSSGRTTRYRTIRLFNKAVGNQKDGYTLVSRQAVVAERSETEPSERSGSCPQCREIEVNTKVRVGLDKAILPDLTRPTSETPVAMVNYWNSVRAALAQSDSDIALWAKVRDTLELYRSEAQAASAGN